MLKNAPAGTENQQTRLLEPTDWINEAKITALALERFLPDIGVNTFPPANCRLKALNLLQLRPAEWLNDSIVTSGMATLCEEAPDAATYSTLSSDVASNISHCDKKSPS